MKADIEIMGLQGKAGPDVFWITGHIQVIIQDADLSRVDMLPLCVQCFDDVFWATLSASCSDAFSKSRNAEYVFVGKHGTRPTTPAYTLRMLSSFLPYDGGDFVKNESDDRQQEIQERKDGHFAVHSGKERRQY